MERDVFISTGTKLDMQEGILSDMLVKWKIVDAKKFIEGIFNAIDKKIRVWTRRLRTLK